MRLDRALYNDGWFDSWSNTSCCTLTHSKSDHHPLLFSTSNEAIRRPSHFKFLKMWTAHPDCRRLVSSVWCNPVVGCPMFILSHKLKLLKLKLKSWNKCTFGNVHEKVDHALTIIDQIQEKISLDGWSESLAAQE